MGDTIVYRRLRAPRDAGPLVDPPAGHMPVLARDNRRQLIEHDRPFAGQSLSALAARARGEFLAAALDFTRSYRDVSQTLLARIAASAEHPPTIYLAGHQPELFHAGVWFKNFVLARSAARDAAVAVNLVIDGDAVHAVSLRVPSGSRAQPTLERVEFDLPGAEVAYEERSIRDRQRFASFGDRVRQRLAPLVADPLIDELWPLAIQRAEQGRLLGECLAQARHQLEATWGLESLELPHSRVCGLPAYRQATAALLADLPRLRDDYNASLAEYRRVHKLRSSAHPAPDLWCDGDGIEAPYWVWQVDAPQRRRLFIRRVGRQLELSDRAGWTSLIPAPADRGADVGSTAAALDDLERSGVKIRPRALVTTMLARLLLGDLFMHGIGGAKYDQVTDALVGRYLSRPAPAIVTATATLRLPIDYLHGVAGQLHAINQELRALEFHPERFLELHQHPPELQRKRHWIGIAQTRDNARERCQAIRAANRELQHYVAGRQGPLLAERTRLVELLAHEKLLGSREFSFCLFPRRSAEQLLAWA